jgi:hypothetical protein
MMRITGIVFLNQEAGPPPYDIRFQTVLGFLSLVVLDLLLVVLDIQIVALGLLQVVIPGLLQAIALDLMQVAILQLYQTPLRLLQDIVPQLRQTIPHPHMRNHLSRARGDELSLKRTSNSSGSSGRRRTSSRNTRTTTMLVKDPPPADAARPDENYRSSGMKRWHVSSKLLRTRAGY